MPQIAFFAIQQDYSRHASMHEIWVFSAMEKLVMETSTV